MSRRYIPLAAIVAIILVGVVAWVFAYKMQYADAPLLPAPSPTSTPSVYRNDEYGFEIAYPDHLSPEMAFREYQALSSKWRANAPEGQTGKALVAIPVFRVEREDGTATGKPFPLYFGAEVRVVVSADPQAVADCLKTDQGYADQTHEAVVLNGTLFERFDFADAAMMQYVQGSSYRVVREGMCFAIEQIRTGSNYRDESMTEGILQTELDAYYAKAGEIARTIRFTR